MTEANAPAGRRRGGLVRRLELLQQRLPASRKLVILDVGANPVIPPPYRRLLRKGGCTVVGFEPQADAFAKLQETRGENEVYINAALGKPGRGTLHLYASDGFTSLYRLRAATLERFGQVKRQLGTERQIEVDLRGIDEIDEITDIDLLKIDVQGAERDVIASGRGKLAEAVCIIPEMRFYPLYEGEPTFAELDAELRAQGFVLHKFLSQMPYTVANSMSGRFARSAHRSQLMDGDAVYIRSLETTDQWSDDQIAHLALAADAVFDSPDLALRMIDILVERGRVEPDLPRVYARLLDGFIPHGRGKAARKKPSGM